MERISGGREFHSLGPLVALFSKSIQSLAHLRNAVNVAAMFDLRALQLYFPFFISLPIKSPNYEEYLNMGLFSLLETVQGSFSKENVPLPTEIRS